MRLGKCLGPHEALGVVVVWAPTASRPQPVGVLGLRMFGVWEFGSLGIRGSGLGTAGFQVLGFIGVM